MVVPSDKLPVGVFVEDRGEVLVDKSLQVLAVGENEFLIGPIRLDLYAKP